MSVAPFFNITNYSVKSMLGGTQELRNSFQIYGELHCERFPRIVYIRDSFTLRYSVALTRFLRKRRDCPDTLTYCKLSKAVKID